MCGNGTSPLTSLTIFATVALGFAACSSDSTKPGNADGGDASVGDGSATTGDAGDGGNSDAFLAKGPPTTNEEHRGMLDSLGFKTTVGPVKDPMGVPVPTGYHPLRKRYATMNPLKEIYIAGSDVGGKLEHLFNDKQGMFTKLAFNSEVDPSWARADW